MPRGGHRGELVELMEVLVRAKAELTASWRMGVLGVALGVILGFVFWGVFMGSFVVVGRRASWLRGGLHGRLRGRLHGGFMVVFGGSFVVVFVASSGRCQPLLTLLSALSGVGIGEMMAGVGGDSCGGGGGSVRARSFFLG